MQATGINDVLRILDGIVAESRDGPAIIDAPRSIVPS
jgi:hypothetical protein